VDPAALRRGELPVERRGVTGRSLTFRGLPPGWIRGCDAAGRFARSSRWCGSAVGRVRSDGELYDPRLDLACRDSGGLPIAFAWIEALPAARYLVVRGAAYSEVYEAAGGLPIRVTSADAVPEESAALFHVTQLAADGRELSSETVRAAVAG
jgi:hypothetical protein